MVHLPEPGDAGGDGGEGLFVDLSGHFQFPILLVSLDGFSDTGRKIAVGAFDVIAQETQSQLGGLVVGADRIDSVALPFRELPEGDI